jgi:hypothetical protein
MGTFSCQEIATDVDGDGYSVAQDDCDDNNPNINPGEAEVCDGVDNNCDGNIDESYVNTPTFCGTGTCAATGELTCVNGVEVDTCNAGTPGTELCNGLDDDCDGVIDEDYVSLQISCGIGACAASGSTSCVAGQETDSCTPGTPAADDSLCNGLDDDCNGLIDEDYVSTPTSCGTGACAATGQLICALGVTSDTCVIGTPTPEVCDGSDNDCNTATADGLDEAWLNYPTSCGIGECAATGTFICSAGLKTDTCEEGTSVTEICINGLDDDCDGSIDEGCYQWSGFFQPIDPGTLGLFNKVKAGSSIPVKFSLNGDMGLNIFAPDSPNSVKIDCSLLSLFADSVELTVNAGGSSLNYDPLTKQYTYVWKTEKAWTGCRQLVLQLNDGSTHYANFKFTK